MALNKFLLIEFLLSGIITLNAQAPTKYWVKLKDKNNSSYTIANPSTYLSAKSIQRRANQNIAIDLTDIPVNQTYVNQINATGAQVFQKSKWFNAVIAIVTNTNQLLAINNLTCVIGSSPVNKVNLGNTNTDKYHIEKVINTSNSMSSKKTTTVYNYGPSITQVAQIGADCMHDLGFRGNNMTIAVIDDGFKQADTNPVFDSLRNESRLLGTRDFIIGNNAVFEDDTHGAYVLSTISGNSPGNLIGTAPKAKMWLLRSEDATSEKPIEEYTWVIAAEFADSVGVDIATTSLGYTTFDNPAYNHTYADLDGKTAIMSQAATMAARKGIFVLNAAGNEGNGSWHFIGVPADADSICTVGSVNGSGIHSSFSSVGPTADGRIKPDVSTMGEGTYICDANYNFFGGNGTSFATPVMAGAVACLWQAHPTKTNMEILQAIKATATQSLTPDNDYGWGVPNMCAAHQYLITTGIKENTSAITLSFYPNPTQNEMYFNTNETIENIVITDVLGQDVKFEWNKVKNNQYQIIFENTINKGLYSVIIKTKNNILNGKFIKQ